MIDQWSQGDLAIFWKGEVAEYLERPENVESRAGAMVTRERDVYEFT